MATLDEAETARSQHGERLRKLGAHAIEVRERKKGDFALIAQFARAPARAVPEELEIEHRGSTRRVPVHVEIRPEYRPEARIE